METQNVVSKKQKVAKVASQVINILSIVIMLFAVFIVITSLTSKDRGYTAYFGRAYVSVKSDSMALDTKKWDNFKTGDVICFRLISDKEKENLEVGTIITFWDQINGDKQLNTHRIVDVIKDTSGGVVAYVTQGDNNGGVPDATHRRLSDIQGVYVGKSVVMGQVLTYLQSRTGFALFIVVPCVLIMIYCAVLVIMNLMKYSKEKAVIQHEDNVDALKEQLRQQLLKEMAEKEGAENSGEKDENKEDLKTEANNIDAQDSAEEHKEEASAEATDEPKQNETKTDKE